uniref:Prefoldin subunit 4 n=1 Tax=Panagrolaimus superbus TaxID=310955 RepID=A0A914YH53_9BILA
MEPKTSVSAEDQQKINTFARLYDRERQLEMETKSLKNQIGGFNDAEMDILEADDEKIPVKFGQIFIATKADVVSELIEKRKGEAEVKLHQCEEALSQTKKQMDALRKELYKTFGDNISLEIDKD